MTYFIKQANTFRTTPDSSVDIRTKLPAGTFAMKVDDVGLFLEEISSFTLPPKLYGDCTKFTDRIINTFWDRDNSTGVFLEGEKGSGKTLLAKSVSVSLLKQNVPTIVVNMALFGEMFNTFIQSIQQPAVVIFDEFEKIYDEDQQERVLTLFDGVYPSKKLFIVTCNDSWKIDRNMKNRPGRMFYMLSFTGLDRSFIEEYATENLIDKTRVGSVIAVSALFQKFNFDMLKALVEEMNRYNETAQEAMQMLNTKPSSDKLPFDVSIVTGGKALDMKGSHREAWNGDPLTEDVTIEYYPRDPKKRDEYRMFCFEPKHLKEIDGIDGIYTFENDDGDIVTLTRKKENEINWSKFGM